MATPGVGESSSEFVGRGESLAEQSARADVLQAAVAVSVSGRSLVAALGRPGAPIADRPFAPEVAAIQRRALEVLLNTFRTSADRFLSLLPREGPPDADEWRSHLTGLSAAADHLVDTTENAISRGRVDRVHPLYVDRLDQHVAALTLQHAQQGSQARLPFALGVLRLFLEELEAAVTRSCVELQCAGYGVSAPLSSAAKSSLLMPTVLMMSIEPAVMSWLRWFDLADDDREFLLAAVDIAFTAARHYVDHNLALVHGADEFARRGFLVFHQPQWPFNALAITHRLLARYGSLGGFSD
ncbi:MAG: hypothetical protein F4209_11805 [Chloroflexi bacterium]|nr:hypothetical protein [Chloroflexota bacterium]MYF23407.1 hypothetical protein [Chloroflexota bacterium]